MNNFEIFEKDFKRDLLSKVIVAMKHGRMSKESAQKLAKSVLEIFTQESGPNVFAAINKISEIYPQVIDIFILRGNEYDERETEAKINEIRIDLSLGNG
jgi:hypothetical protein